MYWRRRVLLVGVVTLMLIALAVWHGLDDGPQGEQGAAMVSHTTTSALDTAACPVENLSLFVDGVSPVRAGSVVSLTVRVANEGSDPCAFEPSSGPLSVSVRSGTDMIWDSEDCPEWGAAGRVVIDAGGTNAWDMEWPTSRSEPGCRLVDGRLGSGTYIATASLPDVQSARFVFRFVA